MERASIRNGKSAPAVSLTITDRSKPAPAQNSAMRCLVALLPGSGQGFTQEVGQLLRHRLMVAALITATVFCIFFVRVLIDPPEAVRQNPFELIAQGAVSAILVLLAALLGSRLQLSIRQVRAIELVLFGVTALYFGWLQLVVIHFCKYLPAIDTEHRHEILRLATASNSLRWFALIVIYGTFVPNTWRRCALLVGGLALSPLLLTVWSLVGCPRLGPFLGHSLFDMTVVLGLASAIAIFGSYKIGELEHKAFEARELGQYRLKRKLGAGGMGEVYLGEHVLLRRACAIKVIRPDQSADRTMFERFEREVKAMARLTHWNTVEVYDYGRADDGTFYYVMEYLPGLSLQDLVFRHGPLAPARAVHLLRQMCAALQEAHAMGIIHRDIKPSNVIACERGGVYDVVKLLDFGLVQCIKQCQDSDKLTMQGTILGSPQYMSPEQSLGKEGLDARTDVYSAGALGYFLLTGQPPFQRETAMETLVAHVHDQPVPPSNLRLDIPADVEAVILRCLKKDPAQRYQNAEELEEALAACACSDGWTRREALAWWQRSAAGDTLPSASAVTADGKDRPALAAILPLATMDVRTQ